MERIRLTLLSILPLLFLFAPMASRFSSQGLEKKQIDPRTAITFTVETADREVRFFDPLHLQIQLHNNSNATHSLEIAKLRLRPAGWAGSLAIGSGLVEDIRLTLDDHQQQRVVLPAHGSLALSGVDRNATINTLGRVELLYLLVSNDDSAPQFISGQGKTKNKTNAILDQRETSLTLEIGPSDLIRIIWAAQTKSQRDRVQPRFNELLAKAAAVEAKDSEIRDRSYVEGTFKFAGGYSLEFLKVAAKDQDPIVREQAILEYPEAVGTIDELNGLLDELDKRKPRPSWAAKLIRIKKNDIEATSISLAIASLEDPAPKVRIAGLRVLADQKARNAFAFVKTLTADPDPGVRAAAQEYLGKFAGETGAADVIAASLADKDSRVRERALSALLHSPKPPPLDTLKRAFMLTKGATAVGLIPLLFEQEDASFPATLAAGFTARSAEERLAIMTAVAGHVDSSSLALVKLGLEDINPMIQRAALMRLLAFPAATAVPLLDAYDLHASPSMRPVAEAVRREIETRTLWPFLAGTNTVQTSATESVFPSRNGTTPVVSPDGNWLAYEETGWGRPGGTGGFGASNRISISHAVRNNGVDDRVVSDLYLIGWLSDSCRIATARDSFAAVTDLNGKVTAEFGDVLPEQYRQNYKPGVDWRNAELRQQFGGEMPHQKYLIGIDDITFRDGGAFSPDGKWYGPITRQQETFLLGADGLRMALQLPLGAPGFGFRATWSPSGRHVLFHEDTVWLILDMQNRTSHRVPNVDYPDFPVREGRWSPWSKDGSRLTFLRAGQVWISGPNGEDAKQLTFDSTRKAVPTFSRDGRFVAYLTWQPDDRLHYTRLGPTDLWIVDSETTLATRVTAPARDRINNLDWLDDQNLIFDRQEQDSAQFTWPNPRSSLRKLSLQAAQ